MMPSMLALIVPLASALVVAVVPRSEPGLARALGLIGALIEAAVIAWLCMAWDAEGPALQFAFALPWVPALGVGWSFGLDANGSWPLVWLALIVPAALMVGPQPRVAGILIVEAAWVAVILARDVVVLACAWELATIVLVLLLAERGDAKLPVPGRTAAARRYAMHVLPGAATLVAAVAVIGVAHAHATGGMWSWDVDDLATVVMPAGFQRLGFGLILLTIATSLPLVPLHGWLGPTSATAPSSMLALVLGLGAPMTVVLLERLALPAFPLAFGEWADPLAGLAIFGALLAGLACWAEREPGRMLGHLALLHGSLVFLATLEGTVGGRMALGPLGLAQGLGLTLLVMVLGWLRRRKVADLGELAGWAAVAPRGLALAIAGVLIVAGVPGTLGFLARLDMTIAGFATGDDASTELLHPRTWALLAPIALTLGTLGALRTIWHAARGRPRPGLSERLGELGPRERIVGAVLVALALASSPLVGALAAQGGRGRIDGLDDFHLARCLAIEGREQARPRLRSEFSGLCLDPRARIRQVYGLAGHDDHEEPQPPDQGASP